VPQVYGLSDVGCVRKNNEDSFLIDPVLGLYLIADGMGGAQAVETIAESIAAELRNDEQALRRAIDCANRRIRQRSAEEQGLEGMGTTIVAVLLDSNSIYLASVGDSRIYIYDSLALTPVFEDQTWVNEIGRVIGLDDQALKNHPMRHVLTMALGVTDDLRIQSARVQPHAGWQILLCSDGLHGVLESKEIENILASEISLEAKCHSLIESAKQAGGPDNVTVVLLAW
jgi:serine/threonine protein phosphatase PrpC